ncbi:MAG: ATP-binding cassette, subfamily bacterial [Patescibacteria group bacterium]|nr:ATP-binding cassette, subfamily bacterial [Patescibacteria group bacterium]
MEDKKKKSTVKYSRIFYYFWKATKGSRVGIFTLTFFVLVATIVGSIFQPLVYQKLLDYVSISSPFWSKELKDLLVLLIICFFLSSFSWRVVSYISTFITNSIAKKLSLSSFNKILPNSRKFFVDNSVGSIISKNQRFVGGFGNIFSIIIYTFLPTIVVLTGVIFVLFNQNRLLGFIFSVWSLIFIITSFFFAKYKMSFDEDRAKSHSRASGVFSDIIANIFNVKIFSNTKHEIKKYEETVTDLRNKAFKTWMVGSNQDTVQAFATFALRVSSMWIVVDMWARGQANVGLFILVQMYVSIIFDYVWTIGRSMRDFASTLSDSKEMVEIFDAEIDIKDPENPEECRIKNGEIAFENVSFEYKDGKDVFKDFNLQISSGQKVGIVGHSGSGKTTITNLLLRFEDVAGGAIKIDGQDIRNITQDDLRRKISYVPQEPVLFHRTLKENIAYGDPDATDKEIDLASRKAHAEEFIKELKDGYETLVGERGVKLSGGQRQRIAIARVMLENSPILILDEATSSLDSISENLIQKAFDEAMKNRTTIVIAHRLSTIKKMDRIIVLDKGKIVEDGTHEDLLSKKGYYEKLWNAQKDGVI